MPGSKKNGGISPPLLLLQWSDAPTVKDEDVQIISLGSENWEEIDGVYTGSVSILYALMPLFTLTPAASR